MRYPDLEGPTLLLRPDIAQRNIRRMAAKAHRSGTRFRPHFKTHQSHHIGRWFRDAGVSHITVSSLAMAEYFAADGWEDITIAIPVNLRQLPRLNALARKVRLHVIVDAPAVATALKDGMEVPLSVWVELDCGDGRTGIPCSDTERVLATASVIRDAALLTLGGLISHAGQSYSQVSPSNAIAFFRQQLTTIQGVRSFLAQQGFSPDMDISLGDTPTFSILDDLEGLEEARPGNFIFFDQMQMGIGACGINDVAVAMACPVISIAAHRAEAIVHGGAVHFSKDYLSDDDHPYKNFGRTVWPIPGGWAPFGEHFLHKLSQEHGTVHFNPSNAVDEIRHGDLLFFLPIHSCLTADLMGEFALFEGGTVTGWVETMLKPSSHRVHLAE